MPNWTRNRIYMDGLEDSILIGTDTEGNKIVDFNKVIPMPEELAEVEQGGFEKEALLLALDTLKNITESEHAFGFIAGADAFSVNKAAVGDAEKCVEKFDKDRDKIIAGGLRYIRNALTYGHMTWYGWSIENWGTKWNATVDDMDVSDDCAEFETAWSAPLPVVQKLSELYPEREVCIEWADESANSTGYIVYKNGKQISGGEDTDIKNIRSTYESVWGYEPDFLDEEEEAE